MSTIDTAQPPCPLCGSTASWHRCLGAELPARDDDRIDLAAEVAEIRSGLADLQERFYRVMQAVRGMPRGDWLYDRVDAYPGLRLDRDMGAGLNADAWLAEVVEFLDEEPAG